MLCADCGTDLATEWKGQWRHVCCACGKTLHDSCWITRLETVGHVCECGGGFNLWSYGTQVTECYTEDPEYVPPKCRCES